MKVINHSLTMDGNQQGPACRCPHHSVWPALVLLIGLDFLLGATGTLSAHFVQISWPILLMLGALMKLVNRCKCCSWRGW